MKGRNLQLLLIIAILIAVNLLASGIFTRIDLTKERRYSLSDVSHQTMGDILQPMFVQVYMEGDFPPNIRRLQDAIRTTLIELKQYSGGRFDYRFVDPSNNEDILNTFRERGLFPIPVTFRKSATETENKYMFPVARMIYGDKEQYVDLLKGCAYPNGEINFMKAEADLEFKLVSAIRNLLKEQGGLIAILQGHGEQPVEDMGEWITEMQNAYNVAFFDQTKAPGEAISPSVNALIIPQPTAAFSERDKYELDQYLMRGGSIFFLMNQQIVDMDMFEKRSTLTQLRDLNLDDMFMKYGFKLNYDLVQDLSCESTEVFQPGPSGGSVLEKKWIFYPMAFAFPGHPLDRNVDAVLMRYPSSIEPLAREGVEASVFLTTSEYSRTIQGSQFVDLAEYLENPPPPALFNKGPKITGLLLEGTFESLFAGREVPLDSAAPNPPTAKFGARSGLPGKVAILSDGSFMLGKTFRGKRGYLPYDNKALLMNVTDYLAGDEALTGIRSKEVVIRRLDGEKVRDNAGWIRWMNLVLPVVAVVVFGVGRGIWRRRRWE